MACQRPLVRARSARNSRSEPPPEDAETEAEEGRARAVGRAARGLPRRVFGFLWRNAYLGLAAGAVLVATEAIDFDPPPEVRVGNADVGALVGDAPAQEFAHELSNPQAVQVRATLRLYPNNEMVVGAPDPDLDEQAKILSQPVITTILGMNATVEQTIRLDGGDLEVDLEVHGTPRLGPKSGKSKAPAPMTLEHEVKVRSRRDDWWRTRRLSRVHLDSRGTLDGVEDGGYRIVFTVDEHLFSLDIEARRALGGFAPTSLASVQ